ncbi:Xaa-Pro dipeptidase [Litorimonas cladophorae]|uniref:Xaa-Pro dipeptidase n=1 Tax=Litorimonas cladophorae TaxID=1220491 RepID=A0A918KIM3_9PROT|nr:amidohydrolase family protein [Litorimonas cladophorae]GGX64608.1 Xaa-Pro dipeptidase [Litorimonas cladophorae]
MTYRTLLSSALYTSLAIGALGVAFSAFADEDTMESHEDFTLIHAGHVMTVPGERVLSDHTIIIHDGKIVGVEPGFLEDDDATIINGEDMFFLPGLIDSHVHLRGDRDSGKPDDAVRLESGDVALQAAAHARTTLLAGFTAVQDVGGPKEIFALRRAINKGLVPGPHIRAAGSSIAATGGHGDFHGFKDDILKMMKSETVCDGVADCRRAVRQAVKNGADVIKITATGGVMSDTNAGTGQQLMDDELEAIVEAAASMGRKVTAHAHDKGGIEAALRAGVSSIEHGSFMDAETTRLFKKYDAVLVPTVLAGKTVEAWAADPETTLSANSVKKARDVGPAMQDMARLAFENGVTIAFGTDSGVSKHGQNAKEFQYMVAAGMSETEAIRSATVVASKHIQLDDVIGTLEAGKFADLIGVDGDPRKDISELMDVDFVMKGGVVYKGQ